MVEMLMFYLQKYADDINQFHTKSKKQNKIHVTRHTTQHETQW